MRLRPPVPADLGAVFAVIEAREQADIGRTEITAEDLRGEWTLSELDLASDARVVQDGSGRIVGYGLVRRPGALGLVDPAQEGRGAGSLLIEWLEARERELGRRVNRQYVASTNRSAEQLLDPRGYALVRSNWRMVRALDEVAEPEAPDGIELRTLEPERDLEAMHALDQRAFADDPGYQPSSLAHLRESHVEAHDAAPELSLVATQGDAVAGFLLTRLREQGAVAYVDVLAVDPQFQRRGIGRALLLAAFSRYAADGRREAQLDVSSVNPRALGLYEGAGMAPRFRYDIYERSAGAPLG